MGFRHRQSSKEAARSRGKDAGKTLSLGDTPAPLSFQLLLAILGESILQILQILTV